MKRKILLVDGYNMVAFWQETRSLFNKGELDAARTILLNRLSNYASFEKLEIICVFDAQYMPGVRQTYDEFNVTVVFTEEEETADDYIVGSESNEPTASNGKTTFASYGQSNLARFTENDGEKERWLLKF